MARPKIVTSDVYKYIAKRSSLTNAQVRECFETYYELVMGIVESDNKPDDFCIALPKFGLITFRKCKGLKKGYKYPWHGEIVTIEEDKPDYEKMKIEISKNLQSKVREASENRFIKKKSLNFNFLKDGKNE